MKKNTHTKIKNFNKWTCKLIKDIINNIIIIVPPLRKPCKNTTNIVSC